MMIHQQYRRCYVRDGVGGGEMPYYERKRTSFVSKSSSHSFFKNAAGSLSNATGTE